MPRVDSNHRIMLIIIANTLHSNITIRFGIVVHRSLTHEPPFADTYIPKVIVLKGHERNIHPSWVKSEEDAVDELTREPEIVVLLSRHHQKGIGALAWRDKGFDGTLLFTNNHRLSIVVVADRYILKEEAKSHWYYSSIFQDSEPRTRRLVQGAFFCVTAKLHQGGRSKRFNGIRRNL